MIIIPGQPLNMDEVRHIQNKAFYENSRRKAQAEFDIIRKMLLEGTINQLTFADLGLKITISAVEDTRPVAQPEPKIDRPIKNTTVLEPEGSTVVDPFKALARKKKVCRLF